MAGERENDLDDLALELGNDKYPLPEERGKDPLPKEGQELSYDNVDITIKFRKESKKDSVTDEKRILFTDSGFEVEKLLYDEARGILKVPVVLAKEMVYNYDEYSAFRPRDELEAIAPYVKGVPVTRGHPEAKIVTDRGEVLGCVVDAEFEDDELRGVLEISDKSLIEDIRSGKLKGVSPGHFSRLDKSSSGKYEGKHYDVTQRDIFIDHIAIVEEGRCSVTDGCGIVGDAEIENKEIKKREGDEDEIMESKDKAKGVDATEGVAEKKVEEIEGLLKEIAESKEEISGILLSKVKKALEITAKMKEIVAGMDKEEKEEGDAAGAETDEAVAKLKGERDELRKTLDAIEGVEKEKLIDELGTLQDVKTEAQLKEMSVDSLKSDLELVKSLKGGKFTVDDAGRIKGGKETIKGAYKEVGRKGGKE